MVGSIVVWFSSERKTNCEHNPTDSDFERRSWYYVIIIIIILLLLWSRRCRSSRKSETHVSIDDRRKSLNPMERGRGLLNSIHFEDALG